MARNSVCITVATFKRPRQLQALLSSLQAAIEYASVDACWVIVVDNDPAESARETCEGWSECALQYVPQPLPGIAATRNAAVRLALYSDFLIFVDDDEVVAREWLQELLEVQATTDADLVAGPVYSTLPADTAERVKTSRLFDRPSHENLSEMTEAGSGNLLCRTVQFAERPEAAWFQESYSLTGGSDAELTRRFHREGARIVWAANAWAWEGVPPSRANFRWLSKRYRRVGSIDFRLAPERPAKRIVGVMSGVARVVSGVVGVSWVLATRHGQVDARAFRRLFRGVGYVEAATLGGYAEYKRRAPK